jgi:chromosome partitioning protein
VLTVALISQKGGAGKSTLALHLATEAVARGMRTVLIDLDPQGNVAQWGNRRGDRPPDVCAEHPANLDRALGSASEEGYDLAVLDTAPHADRTAFLAAKTAHLILAPCRPATFDLEAVQTTLDLCQMTKRRAIVVLNAAPIRSRVVEEARAQIEEGGGLVCPVVLHHRVAFQHSLIDGRTAAEFEPGGAAAAEITRLYDYMMACLHGDTSALRAA